MFGGLGKELGAGSASWVAPRGSSSLPVIAQFPLLPTLPLVEILVSTSLGWDQPYRKCQAETISAAKDTWLGMNVIADVHSCFISYY